MSPACGHGRPPKRGRGRGSRAGVKRERAPPPDSLRGRISAEEQELWWGGGSAEEIKVLEEFQKCLEVGGKRLYKAAQYHVTQQRIKKLRRPTELPSVEIMEKNCKIFSAGEFRN